MVNPGENEQQTDLILAAEAGYDEEQSATHIYVFVNVRGENRQSSLSFQASLLRSSAKSGSHGERAHLACVQS